MFSDNIIDYIREKQACSPVFNYFFVPQTLTILNSEDPYNHLQL